MRKIKIADPYISAEIESNVVKVLRSKNLVGGETVSRFESRLKEYLGVKNALAVSNGTAALHIAFCALGIKGKKVVTSAFTFAASANAIVLAGGLPAFADISLEDYNLDSSSVEELMDDSVVALEPVHLYGQCADMDSVQKVAKQWGVSVVEDAAQAIGSTFRGQMAGSFGVMGCFSTYATKNLQTGEGGFITTNDSEIARSIELLRNHGQRGRYNHVGIGFNYRMTELQAAIGLPQMDKLEEFIAARRENARILTEGLGQLTGLTTPVERPEVRHVFHQYTILVNKAKAPIGRDKLAERLAAKGIETSVHYPLPVYLQPYYVSKYGYRRGTCPNSEYVASSVLSLPVHQSLSPDDLDIIVRTVRESMTN